MPRPTVLFIVGLVLGVVLGWQLCRLWDIDRCLDRGGRRLRGATL